MKTCITMNPNHIIPEAIIYNMWISILSFAVIWRHSIDAFCKCVCICLQRAHRLFGSCLGVRTATQRWPLAAVPPGAAIDFVPRPQPTANLEVSWRNEIASDGIDSHLTALTQQPPHPANPPRLGSDADSGKSKLRHCLLCIASSLISNQMDPTTVV